MNSRPSIALFAALGLATALSACPRYAPTDPAVDDAGGGGAGGAASTGEGGQGGSDPCPEACVGVYACGLELVGGKPRCPGFVGLGDEAGFLAASHCVEVCEMNKSFVSLVDTKNCAGTLDVLSNASSSFEMACANGFATSGSGGAGGDGGSGGK
ncbi:MAG: hypothetical protein FJ095_14420 [Deltaproteobacteria bacterium]|nr:hypothetical protein [Deltaproteobacteria bacterium]